MQSGTATVSGDEAHHLIHVMRAKSGTTVTLFSGDGMEYDAKVESVGRNTVRLMILSQRHVDRELAVELTLAVALPKGDRQKWLVEKAVEIGGHQARTDSNGASVPSLPSTPWDVFEEA